MITQIYYDCADCDAGICFGFDAVSLEETSVRRIQSDSHTNLLKNTPLLGLLLQTRAS